MWLAETLWHARVSPWSQLADVDDDGTRVGTPLGAAGDARSGRRRQTRASRLSPRRTGMSQVRGARALTRSRRCQPDGVLVPAMPTERRFSGEGGIRTLDERITTRNALAGRRLQPLGHLSRVAQDIGRAGRLS